MKSKGRVVLISPGSSGAEELKDLLQRVGYAVDTPAEQGGSGLRSLGDDPPGAFVIDLQKNLVIDVDKFNGYGFARFKRS